MTDQNNSFDPNLPPPPGGATSYPYTPPPQQPKSNRTWIIIAVVVAVLLCCCCLGVAGWYAYNNGDAWLEPTTLVPFLTALL